MHKTVAKLVVITQRLQVYLLRPTTARRAYVYFLSLATLFVLPIILANVDYIDDTARHLSGYYGWSLLGRVMTELLMHFLTFSANNMPDMGHQMQILCIPVLAYAGFIFAQRLRRGRPLTPLQLVVASILVVNPFLLPNLSFRFDSFSMITAYALSIGAAIIAMREGWSWGNWLLSVVLLFVATGMYQPEILMYLVITTTLFVVDYADSEVAQRPFVKYLRALAGFVGGVILYYGILKVFSFSAIGSADRGVLVPLTRHGARLVLRNIHAGLHVSFQFIRNDEALVLAILCSLLLFGGLITVLVKEYRRRGLVSSLLLFAAPVILILAIMGPFAFMISTLTYQVRTLSAAIGLVLLAFVLLYYLVVRTRRPLAWLTVLPILVIAYLINFSFVYGSALVSQREQDKIVYSEIEDVLADKQDITQTSNVYIGGVPSTPLSVQTQLQKRPALSLMDIGGNNSVWYVWNTLLSSSEVKGANWYVGSADEEKLRHSICASPNQGLVGRYKYFEIRSQQPSEYIFWLIDPGVGKGTFCTP